MEPCPWGRAASSSWALLFLGRLCGSCGVHVSPVPRRVQRVHAFGKTSSMSHLTLERLQLEHARYSARFSIVSSHGSKQNNE